MSIASKNQSRARKLLRKAFGDTEVHNDTYGKRELPKYLKVYKELRTSFSFLKGNGKGNKFFPAIVRMYLNKEFNDSEATKEFGKAMPFLIDSHIQEYNEDLNGLPASEIVNRFAQTVKTNLEKDYEKIVNILEEMRKEKKVERIEDLQNPDYEIKLIKSIDDAEKYKKYTSWCINSAQSTLDNYTHGGFGQFYFCLKKGFENMEERSGKNAPLDEYGLSMLAVCVDVPNSNENIASLKSCTCRWNHSHGGNENVMNAEAISRLLGVNFYDTFKPNMAWFNLVKDIKEKLKNSDTQLHEIFKDGNVYELNPESGTTMVVIKSKYNFVNNKRELISNIWFDKAEEFSEGLSVVQLEGKGWNYIDINGNFITDKTYKSAQKFSCGLGAVEVREKGWTFINKKGVEVTKDYYKSVGNFSGKYAHVEIDNKGYTFITKRGRKLSTKFYEKVHSFVDGYAAVYINGKGWIYIDEQGKELIKDETSKEPVYFEKIYSFDREFGVVCKNNKWNIITKAGKFLSAEWFKNMYYGVYNYFVIESEKGWNFISYDGNILSKEVYFKEASSFKMDGFGRVVLKTGEQRRIDSEGNLHPMT